MIKRSARSVERRRRAAAATGGKPPAMPGPTDNPATNLMFADVAIRAASYVVRRTIERGMLRGRYGPNTAKSIIENKSLGQTLTSFALARLATRNLPGAVVVGGGALAKTLYDRSKSKHKERRKGDSDLIKQARGEN
ncbi:hypothetical protein [Qipengyuania sp.]|uniref:hypothetical protein n=1 Tax=Qipengyuania sp. TaxID=2004515 RepID=UPI003735B7E2